MLPLVLLFLQLPLCIEGPLWAVCLNAVALLGASYTMHDGIRALSILNKLPICGRTLCEWTWWRSIIYCHSVVVPPWFFLGRQPGYEFSFPLLIALGVGLGLFKLADRSFFQTRDEQVETIDAP